MTYSLFVTFEGLFEQIGEKIENKYVTIYHIVIRSCLTEAR